MPRSVLPSTAIAVDSKVLAFWPWVPSVPRFQWFSVHVTSHIPRSLSSVIATALSPLPKMLCKWATLVMWPLSSSFKIPGFTLGTASDSQLSGRRHRCRKAVKRDDLGRCVFFYMRYVVRQGRRYAKTRLRLRHLPMLLLAA